MKSIFFPILLTMAMALTGCNGIAGPDHGDPYLVLKGKITNQAGLETPEDTRVALLWMNMEEDEVSPFKVAQETEVNAEFPSFFQLSVDELPPQAAMMDLQSLEAEFPPGRKVALGAIIVYHDGNDNHQLDLIEESATESVDTVLGVPLELIVIYLEGPSFEFMDEGGVLVGLESGFNLLEMTSQDALDACYRAYRDCEQQAQSPEEVDLCFDREISCLDQVEEQDPPETIPLDTEIVIELDSDPRLASFLCKSSGLESSGGSGGTGHEFDITDPDSWPEDLQIVCDEDGLSFDYYWQEDHSTLCYSSASGGTGRFSWTTGEPLPAWWPCQGP